MPQALLIVTRQSMNRYCETAQGLEVLCSAVKSATQLERRTKRGRLPRYGVLHALAKAGLGCGCGYATIAGKRKVEIAFKFYERISNQGLHGRNDNGLGPARVVYAEP